MEFPVSQENEIKLKELMSNPLAVLFGGSFPCIYVLNSAFVIFKTSSK